MVRCIYPVGPRPCGDSLFLWDCLHVNEVNTMHYTPAEIFTNLKKYVKGQDDALKQVSTAVSIHVHSYLYHETVKTNIMLIGNTGCGKTETVRALQAMSLPVPVLLISALDYSVSAWRGRDFDEVFAEAFRKSLKKVEDDDLFDYDEEAKEIFALRMAEHAIIVIDEFDKLRREDRTEDNFKQDYQHVLLTTVEGKDIRLKINDTKHITVNTSNMMFVFLGAFSGLEEIIKRRISPPASIGFSIEPEDKPTGDLVPTTDDIVNYGFALELAGRIPVRICYHPMTKAGLIDIIKHAKNSPLKQMMRRSSLMHCKLRFTDGAIAYIAEQSLSNGTGVRGVDAILTDIMYETLFRVTDGKEYLITIDENVAKKLSEPVVEEAKKARCRKE